MFIGEGEELRSNEGMIERRPWEEELEKTIETMEFYRGNKVEFVTRAGDFLLKMGMGLPFKERVEFVRKARGLLEKRYGAEVEKLAPAEKEKKTKELRDMVNTLEQGIAKFFEER